MKAVSRRTFLAQSSLTLSAAALAASSKVPVGLELYSVRDELMKDLPGTVRAVAKMGYQVVEFYAPYFAWTPAEAKEVEAISACIIPSDGTPGAREAGVVYFIDRALVTFSADEQKTYREGLPEIQKRLQHLFPTETVFSAAAPEKQVAVLESLDEAGSKNPPRRPRANFIAGTAAQFFETIRAHTLAGFLIDPESDRRGNSGGVGWAVIGHLPEHGFQPPFGYYDKGYAGWQPASAAKESAKND